MILPDLRPTIKKTRQTRYPSTRRRRRYAETGLMPRLRRLSRRRRALRTSSPPTEDTTTLVGVSCRLVREQDTSTRVRIHRFYMHYRAAISKYCDVAASLSVYRRYRSALCRSFDRTTGATSPKGRRDAGRRRLLRRERRAALTYARVYPRDGISLAST